MMGIYEGDGADEKVDYEDGEDAKLCSRCGHTAIYCYCPNTLRSEETINHPAHYGGADNPYEVIKVIEAWDLGFHLGNVVKYVYRGDKKGALIDDLKKARWYLDRKIEMLDGKPQPPRQEKV